MPLIFSRLALAALFLLLVAAALKKAVALRAHGRHYLVLGLFNSALPFLLFAHAAQTVSASLLSILNATAPLWAAVIGAALTRTALAGKTLLGLALGSAGVALLVGIEAFALPDGGMLALLAALAAAAGYGIATNYAWTARSVEPFANACGSMVAATLLLVPLLPVAPWPSSISPTVAAAVLALGVLCSGIAYLLYFRLIADLGAAPALTVTYLIPVFGILWGALFLDEHVGWHTLAGTLAVLAGTACVTNFSPRALLARPRA